MVVLAFAEKKDYDFYLKLNRFTILVWDLHCKVHKPCIVGLLCFFQLENDK